MAKTLNKHIRVDEDHWERIEQAAKRRGISPSRLMIEATLQAMEGPEWPRTEIEIRVARSCLFTAQAIARDMIATGRGEQLEQIRRDVSHMAPELPGEQSDSPPITTGPNPAAGPGAQDLAPSGGRRAPRSSGD